MFNIRVILFITCFDLQNHHQVVYGYVIVTELLKWIHFSYICQQCYKLNFKYLVWGMS
jgi:hypothetical protein